MHVFFLAFKSLGGDFNTLESGRRSCVSSCLAISVPPTHHTYKDTHPHMYTPIPLAPSGNSPTHTQTPTHSHAIRESLGYEASDIPDSERREFLTKNGRVVRDGGAGLCPLILSVCQCPYGRGLRFC